MEGDNDLLNRRTPVPGQIRTHIADSQQVNYRLCCNQVAVMRSASYSLREQDRQDEAQQTKISGAQAELLKVCPPRDMLQSSPGALA